MMDRPLQNEGAQRPSQVERARSRNSVMQYPTGRLFLMLQQSGCIQSSWNRQRSQSPLETSSAIAVILSFLQRLPKLAGMPQVFRDITLSWTQLVGVHLIRWQQRAIPRQNETTSIAKRAAEQVLFLLMTEQGLFLPKEIASSLVLSTKCWRSEGGFGQLRSSALKGFLILLFWLDHRFKGLVSKNFVQIFLCILCKILVTNCVK